MITRTFSASEVVWDDGDEAGMEVPEMPILCFIDSGGTICVEQKGQSIVLQSRTVDELIRALKATKKASEEFVRKKK